MKDIELINTDFLRKNTGKKKYANIGHWIEFKNTTVNR